MDPATPEPPAFAAPEGFRLLSVVMPCYRLAGSVGKEPRIDFVDMPEKLKGKYQYHTEAETAKLRAAGCDVPFRPLEDAVKDYVETHLSRV